MIDVLLEHQTITLTSTKIETCQKPIVEHLLGETSAVWNNAISLEHLHCSGQSSKAPKTHLMPLPVST